MNAAATSCGVIVTDGRLVLLGHATRSPRWDLPKGIAELGESHRAAARRELREETGLDAPEAVLLPLGVFAYRRGKDLALFRWQRPTMPDPASLVCTSLFAWQGRLLPEFDKFGLFTRDEALQRVGRDMARLLAGIPLDAASEASGCARGRAK